MRMGELLRAMGLVSRGHVHPVNPVGDLASPFVGEYAQLVAEHFQHARGGILFIDEAYQLAEQEQGRQVIHQIVQTLTSPGFADTVVVLAGYRDPMNSLIQANSGLQGRIPNEVVFEELTDQELVELFDRMVAQRQLVVHEADRAEVVRRLIYRLSELRCDPNFASARTLQSVVQDVVDRQTQRVEAEGTRQRQRVVPGDIAETLEPAQHLTALLDAFSQRFVGLEPLKHLLRKLAVSGAARRSRGAEAPPAPRLLFLGNPGTGKTIAAREAARILRAVGCTSTDRVIEVRGIELKGSYLGQTKDRVLKAFQDARGGVLIIDEAYALQTHDQSGGDSYATEAIDTLVGQSQLPENVRTAVILAGYTEPMRRFLRSNPGLGRRFPEMVEFADYSTAQCLDILRRWFEREGGHERCAS
jgi:SpoVK/Ycf46/Vps4 family AAA+-type ATPase